MSLVERALKKLQETAHAAPALPTRAVNYKEIEAAAPAMGTASGSPTQPTEDMPAHVVELDRENLRALKLLPPVNLERRVASQYQHIKRPLVTSAFAQGEAAIPNGHLIMLASAIPGEGKTFTSINLALSMAMEKDIEVLLVDADVAKPHVSRLLGIEKERGLLDLLTDSGLRASSVIMRTDVPGLSVLGAGRQIETATELLASQRMREVALQLSGNNRRRIVLFDSPPLLLSTESRALVPTMGQVVLIVRAESTPHSAVMAAIEAVGEGKPISLILNQSKSAPSEGYYGYGSYGDTGSASS